MAMSSKTGEGVRDVVFAIVAFPDDRPRGRLRGLEPEQQLVGFQSLVDDLHFRRIATPELDDLREHQLQVEARYAQSLGKWSEAATAITLS